MDLGKAPGRERYRFGSRYYVVGDAYSWKELPVVVQRDIVAQADEIEARFGRDYRTLRFRLVIIPHAALLRILNVRFGEEGLARRLSDRKVRALAKEIQHEGLQYPPVLEEGIQRALAVAYLGWDMPYFLLDEPIEMPEPRFIPTLDGRAHQIHSHVIEER